MDRRAFLGVSAAVIAQLAGCTSASDGGDGGDGGGTTAGSRVVETSTVTMADGQFEPRNVAVEAGTTVTWRNEDDTAHTVTSASDNWEKDDDVAAGEETTHTFEEAGVYDVYCTYHGSADLSGMSMKIAAGDATVDSPLGDGGDGGYDPY